MYETIRDAPLGQLIRFVSRRKYLRYADEILTSGAEIFVAAAELSEAAGNKKDNGNNSPSISGSCTLSLDFECDKQIDLERSENGGVHISRTSSGHDLSTLSSVEKVRDGPTLVSWYSDDDPENPRNWSNRKKLFVTFVIDVYTFSIYVGSSIYTSSQSGVMERFGVGEISASLGLALYVLAYGLGSLLFSPLSEIPVIGRSPPYIITFGIFVVLCVPTALADNFAGLLVLRFLQGFFGSPCLATSAASLQDMWPSHKMPYVIAVWAAIASIGPSIGPTLSAFAVNAETWRWSIWEMLWISGPIFVLMFCWLPETSEANILLRRARRLRRRAGKSNIKSDSEIKQATMHPKEVVWDALIKPWQINALDPAVLFSTFYSALVYAIFYSFFESFPLVFPVYYDFDLGATALVFLSVLPALVVACSVYCTYFHFMVEPKWLRDEAGSPEERLWLGVMASPLVPMGLFLFAWTSRASVHWIVPTLGLVIVSMGIFIALQAVFLYLPFTYPKYAASLFAANNCARSMLSFTAILFSRPMFIALGINGGVSLLAGLTVLCVGGIFTLYHFGATLRARSRFAVS